MTPAPVRDVDVRLRPTPWHTTVDRRRVAASAPVLGRSLAMLDEVERWAPSVPLGPRRPTPDEHADDLHWTTDTFSVVLDRRDPAVLADGDPWLERGRTAMWSYRMVDPAIVRAAWWADTPLLGRRLVQEGRFGPLRLRMATEIAAVIDRDVEVDGQTATVVGFEYRTLAGHLEDGWQSWQLWRWHETGVLEHRGHTVSRRGATGNPVIDLGMRVFGRVMQRLAGRRSTSRLALFVGGDPHRTNAPASAMLVRSLVSLPGAQVLDEEAS